MQSIYSGFVQATCSCFFLSNWLDSEHQSCKFFTLTCWTLQVNWILNGWDRAFSMEMLLFGVCRDSSRHTSDQTVLAEQCYRTSAYIWSKLLNSLLHNSGKFVNLSCTFCWSICSCGFVCLFQIVFHFVFLCFICFVCCCFLSVGVGYASI